MLLPQRHFISAVLALGVEGVLGWSCGMPGAHRSYVLSQPGSQVLGSAGWPSPHSALLPCPDVDENPSRVAIVKISCDVLRRVL